VDMDIEDQGKDGRSHVEGHHPSADLLASSYVFQLDQEGSVGWVREICAVKRTSFVSLLDSATLLMSRHQASGQLPPRQPTGARAGWACAAPNAATVFYMRTLEVMY
jgi:hypothetical protein